MSQYQYHCMAKKHHNIQSPLFFKWALQVSTPHTHTSARRSAARNMISLNSSQQFLVSSNAVRSDWVQSMLFEISRHTLQRCHRLTGHKSLQGIFLKLPSPPSTRSKLQSPVWKPTTGKAQWKNSLVSSGNSNLSDGNTLQPSVINGNDVRRTKMFFLCIYEKFG